MKTPSIAAPAGCWATTRAADQRRGAPDGRELGRRRAVATRGMTQACPPCIRCEARGPISASAKCAIRCRNSSSRSASLACSAARTARSGWTGARIRPPFAEYTWDGFSTGTFHDGRLTVTTTHMKMGVLQKVGVNASPYSRADGRVLPARRSPHEVSVVEDPIYLEEPLVRSQSWMRNPNQNVGAAMPGSRSTNSATRRSGGCRIIRSARSTGNPPSSTSCRSRRRKAARRRPIRNISGPSSACAPAGEK